MKIFKEILFPLLAIIFVAIFPHSGIIPFPFTYCIPVLLFVWFYLKLYKEDFASIGFSFKRFEANALKIGTVSGILLIVFLNWIFFPLLEKWFGLSPANLGDFSKITHNTPFYIFLLAMGWIVGGFYEEIVFHGFIFTRLEKMIAGKYAMPFAFILCNILFALYHLQLGMQGVINAFIAGMCYHFLMLRYKRNLWYAIVCHAVFDTIALTLLYAGY